MFFPLSHSPYDCHDKLSVRRFSVCLMWVWPPCHMIAASLRCWHSLNSISGITHKLKWKNNKELRKELNWFGSWFWILKVEWYHIETFGKCNLFLFSWKGVAVFYGTPPTLHWLILTRVFDSLTPSRWAPGTGQWTSSHLVAVARPPLFTPWAHFPWAWRCIEGVGVCFK